MGLVVEVDISAGSGPGTFGQEPQGEGGDILLFLSRGLDPIGDVEAERLGGVEDVNRAAAWCTDGLAGAEERSGVGERPLSCPWMPIVPFKLNQDRRHHIPRQRRKVTNWPAYDASLRQR